MDDFRAILRDNALGATPDVDKAHSTFVGLRDFDKQGLNIILHVRPRLPPPPPPPPPLPAISNPSVHMSRGSTGSAACGRCLLNDRSSRTGMQGPC